ncbi:efflux RND transporter periplasmic adaptor subunit [Marinobacterium rhizophilum]|uniref:efflux RND transporter periplasmic adaptor subunit n=1 Tax=Marinobacterium rhizophilum TaxID=420402 RepID=UPI0003764FB7|nr:efflux RND transporter periplasmic adaptor subunit [Marinobacterium rhizophilum]
MTKTLVSIALLALAGNTLAANLDDVERLLSAPLDAPQQQAADEQSLATDCLLTPSVDARIASPVVGVLDTVKVERGDLVKKGQVLFRLRADVEEATLKLNRAQTEYGKRTITRNTELYEQNLISEQEKDEIVITNRLYGYEMGQTEAMLAQKTIRSPFTGVVVDTFLDPGEYVGEEPILQVVQLDPLYVEVVVPAEYLGKIKTGATAQVTLANPLNSSHRARIEIVDRVLDAASSTFGVRLQLDNPDYLLPAGLKCSVNFELDQLVSK